MKGEELEVDELGHSGSAHMILLHPAIYTVVLQIKLLEYIFL